MKKANYELATAYVKRYLGASNLSSYVEDKVLFYFDKEKEYSHEEILTKIVFVLLVNNIEISDVIKEMIKETVVNKWDEEK